MASIKDVAKLAGVSVATVSRVINKSDKVQNETKARVERAVLELKYSPNLLGRNLRRLETKKILVLLNTISNQFYSQVVKGIEHKALANGYTVMVCMTHSNPNIEKRCLEMLKTKLMDGAILLTAEQDGQTLADELAGIPIVQACEPQERFLTPTVSINNRKAAFDATSYLINKGHNHIAFFGAGCVYASSAQREQGFREALKASGIAIDDSLIFNEGFSFNAGIRAVKALLAQHKNSMPSAIFCVSDAAAAGAIKSLTLASISVPNDISVMGFDDTQLAQIYTPSITTIRQPQYDIGYKAMELLLDVIGGGMVATEKINLPYEIIERESVAVNNSPQN